MKKILIALVYILLTSAAFCEEDFSSFDLQFLDNPFAGQSFVSDKQFDEAVNKMTPKSKGGSKKEPKAFTRWFWGVKGGDNSDNKGGEAPQYEYSNMPSELGTKNILAKPVLTLGAKIMDADGKILESGHYQTDLKKIDGQNYIVFMQGSQTVGRFKSLPATDNWEKNLIVYSRLVEVKSSGTSVYKIIFSNLEGTHQGYAQIVE